MMMLRSMKIKCHMVELDSTLAVPWLHLRTPVSGYEYTFYVINES